MESSLQKFTYFIIIIFYYIGVGRFQLISKNSNFKFDDVIIDAQFGEVYENYVNVTRKVYLIYNSSLHSEVNAMRFQVFSQNNNKTWPLVLVVTRPQSILSWHLPLNIDNSYSFRNLSHTLCPTQFENEQVIFGLSSMSREQTSFIFSAFIKNIDIKNMKNLTLSVMPSTPQYFIYKFPPNVSSVVVKVESLDNICAQISVQKFECPVYDMVGLNEHSQFYATMTTKGAITVTKKSIHGDAFFTVLSVKSNDLACTDFPKIYPELRIKQFVNLRVEELITESQLWSAIMVVLSCYIILYVITFVTHLIYQQKMMKMTISVTAIDETRHLGDSSSRSYGSNEVIRSQPESDEEDKNENINDELQTVASSSTKTKITQYTYLQIHLYVTDMLKERKVNKRHRNYFWNMVTLAIFYFLPVIQLVLTYQKILNNTGNEDVCYYNFYCVYQLGDLVAFNNVFSNIGYILLGLLFLILVYRRENQHMNMLLLLDDESLLHRNGLPQRFDLFYAMGLALLMEGLLSGCYHVCPSYNNFQFDTSFMYMIGWLGMLRIYQSRHQDMSLRSYTAYSIIAFIVLFGVIGVTDGNQAFWICFIIIYILSVLILSFNVYYMGQCSIDVNIFSRCYKNIRYKDLLTSKPKYINRLILLAIGNIVNWGIAVMGLILTPSNFASYLLAIIIVNFLMYFFYYLFMKILNREKIFPYTILFIIFAAILWAFALYFFFNKLTSWQLSPAMSRQSNEDCLWLMFFDYHDIWHFLSSMSLFFSFLVLLTMDDGLCDVPRNQIIVF